MRVTRRAMSLTWILLSLMMTPRGQQVTQASTTASTTTTTTTTTTPTTPETIVIQANGDRSALLSADRLKVILLTPAEQMNVDMVAEDQLASELKVEKSFTVIDTNTSRNGTSVSQHSQFTFTFLESVLLGRAHRLPVIKTITAIKQKKVDKIFLPQLLPLDFGAKVNCPDECPCDSNSPYRTADGHCNNLVHTRWGSSSISMRRWLYPAYDDGVSSPRQTAVSSSPLPSARKVSTEVHTPSDETDQHKSFTHLLMQWGQFIDHDMTSTPTQQIPQGPYTTSVTCCRGLIFSGSKISQAQLNARPQCFPISIPADDRHFTDDCMNFVRSVQVPNANCHAAPVDQLNQITAYLDASQVYGSTQKEQNELRTFTDGKLKELNNHLPPETTVPQTCPITPGTDDYCFLAGDHRVNENPTLQSMHTIFMRGHNRLAHELKNINCHWGDERLFQEARKIVGAVMQVITYGEYLPIILGPTVMGQFELNLGTGFAYTNDYDDTVDASMRNAFATAAFRMGHSMIRSNFSSFDQDFTNLGHDELSSVLGTTHPILSLANRQVGHYARGLIKDCVQTVDCKLTTEVTDNLFLDAAGNSLDLASLNIQRGRDHGLPPYTSWRTFCGLPSVSDFNGLIVSGTHNLDNTNKLKSVYDSVHDIDLFSGGLTEEPVNGGLVGPTFACLLGKQFHALKRGDRFWFEEDNDKVRFTQAQLNSLRQITLSIVICSQTNTTTIQRNAFLKDDHLVKCDDLTGLDLNLWKETLGSWTSWSWWGSCKEQVQTRTRTCSPCNCGCEGKNFEARACNTEPCGWSPWNYWSQCKVDRMYRSRECRCPGCNVEIYPCY